MLITFIWIGTGKIEGVSKVIRYLGLVEKKQYVIIKLILRCRSDLSVGALRDSLIESVKINPSSSR